MKISEYPAVESLTPTAKFVVDDLSGTKTITGAAMQYALFDGIPSMHSLIFRGKNLGTSITAEQFSHISNGDFSNLWIGDYWVLGGNKWVIIDFDYAYGTGINDHHVVLMQMSGNLSTSLHGDTTYNSGYGRVTMHVSTLPNIAARVKNLVGASHVRSLTTRYAQDWNNDTNHSSTNHKDYNDEAWLPSQIQILGARVHKNPRLDVSGTVDTTNQSRQFSYFRLAGHGVPEGLGNGNMWTCDQTHGSYFVYINGSLGFVGDSVRNIAMKVYPYVFIS